MNESTSNQSSKRSVLCSIFSYHVSKKLPLFPTAESCSQINTPAVKEYIRSTVCTSTTDATNCKRKHISPFDCFPQLIPTALCEAQIVIKDGQTGQGDEKKHTVRKLSSKVTDEEVRRFMAAQSGRERLKDLFQTSREDGEESDLQVTVGGMQVGGCIGFMLGWVVGVQQGAEVFQQKHKLTKFPTQYKAVRARTDIILLSGMKEGFKWGVKVAAFTGVLTLTAQSISAYRNKSTVFDHIAGGAAAGGLFRMHLGLRGLVGGSLIGSGIGLLSGSLLYGVQYATSSRQQDVNFERTRKRMDILRSAGTDPFKELEQHSEICSVE